MPKARHTIAVGDAFGRWTVIALTGEPDHRGNYLVHCRCSCGNERWKVACRLKDGSSNSCGCLREELRKSRPKTGIARTPEYRAWAAMISRCSNPKHAAYKNYGARGIRVCDRWNSFSEFLSDLGRKPFADAELDRIDNNGDYKPGNCRWTTFEQNNLNKRNTVWVEYRGERIQLAELCRREGLSYAMVHQRLFKRGFSIENAIRPSKTRVFSFEGTTRNLHEICHIAGIKYATVCRRLRVNGGDLQDALRPVQDDQRKSPKGTE